MKLDALFSQEDLDERVVAGLVRVRRHPTEPLLIANYTSKASFDRAWDHVTRRCRGLIWHGETKEVVARPFEKFFDLNETTHRPPDRPPLAHEKLDGSLGILYPSSGGWRVATRGSFDSWQALWATAYLRDNFESFDAPAGLTPLVEIICRDNRIVVEHHAEGLVLLAAIDHASGADLPLWEVDWWPGSQVDQHVVDSAHDAYLLATSETYEQREGLVLTWYRPNRPSFRAKVKHPRYVFLHGILTAFTERDVWRAVVAEEWRSRAAPSEIGKVLNVSAETAAAVPNLADALALTPPEFCARVDEVVGRLRTRYAQMIAEVDAVWEQHPSGPRRAFAEWANAYREIRSLLFNRLDGRRWQLQAWSLVRPEPVVINAPRLKDEELAMGAPGDLMYNVVYAPDEPLPDRGAGAEA